MLPVLILSCVTFWAGGSFPVQQGVPEGRSHFLLHCPTHQNARRAHITLKQTNKHISAAKVGRDGRVSSTKPYGYFRVYPVSCLIDLRMISSQGLWLCRRSQSSMLCSDLLRSCTAMLWRVYGTSHGTSAVSMFVCLFVLFLLTSCIRLPIAVHVARVSNTRGFLSYVS